MSEALYRPCVSDVLSGDEFLNAVVAGEPCGATPAFPRCPKGEWACDDPACPACEVVEFNLWHRAGGLPPLACPAR